MTTSFDPGRYLLDLHSFMIYSLIIAILSAATQESMSRNIVLHRYAEGDSEHLIRLARVLVNARRQSQTKFAEEHPIILQRASQENSKLSNVFRDPEFVEMILDVMMLDSEFRTNHLLSVNFLANKVIGVSGWVRESNMTQ